MKLNPQERHEQAIAHIKFLYSIGAEPGDPAIKDWERKNDKAVADYYGYKTVAELELAVKACWR